MRILVFLLIIVNFTWALNIRTGNHNEFYRIVLESRYPLKEVPFFDKEYIIFETNDINLKLRNHLNKKLIKKFEFIKFRRKGKLVFRLSNNVKGYRIFRVGKKIVLDLYKTRKNVEAKNDTIAKIINKNTPVKPKVIKLNSDPLYGFLQKTLKNEENFKVIRPVVVVIDPGHGGKDPGAIANGLREKDITLKLARKLKKILEEKKIFKVYLTRNGDYYVDLYSRSVFALKKKADIFISIHCNADRSGLGNGTYIYTLNLKGAKSKLARIVEKRENKAVMRIIKVSNNSYVNRIIAELAINTTMTEGRNFAYILKDKLKGITKVRGIDSANFAVLKTPGIPSVLIETAYLTNKHDAQLLTNPEFLDKFANAITRAIESYFFNYKNVVLNR